MAEQGKSLSGLSSEEAKAFHGLYMLSFGLFSAIALVAHFLVWNWRPWFAG
jgi:light-harvesting complex 1 beta chain